MVSALTSLRDAYWNDLEISDADIDMIGNLLLEQEKPLTPREMIRSLVEARLVELEEQARKAAAPEHQTYLPSDTYEVGDRLVFPALSGAVGEVVKVRQGDNREIGPFRVIDVQFDGEGTAEKRSFASELNGHALNLAAESQAQSEGPETADEVLEKYGSAIEDKLRKKLSQHDDIVQIAGRWFPASLLVDVHSGHLNLAEAVLDVAGGGPLPTTSLLEHIELPEHTDPLLASFSVDYALQEDERFDEVGPAGQTLWYLRRLEPPEVLYTPPRLEYSPRSYDRGVLVEDLIKLESALDDELSPVVEDEGPPAAVEPVTFPLLFPHWRVGALPLSVRLQRLFPTAYEAPRIRFMLVDGHSGDKFPGWVVRQERYVFGLDAWYRRYEVPAGGLVRIRPGEAPGEVIVEALERRRRNDWIRTVSIDDGKVGFTMLKQPVGTAYDDLMVIGLTDPMALDAAWMNGEQRRMDDEQLVLYVFRELAKLNPQSAVHAQSLYSGVNVFRRLPPGPIFAELCTRPHYEHVGDLYWRIDDVAMTRSSDS